jgi:UDP:flavonoid glycosyltransferase YjiC (YdhE family)
MSRILAVWEMGANLGHIDRMLTAARALRDRGHEVRFLLRDLARAHGRLADEGIAFGQAPIWLPRMANPPRLANYAAVLAAAGWLDAPGLAALLLAWRDAFALARPDVVLCDHAPTALLALRGLGIRTWAIGNGFEVPPVRDCFPPLALDNPAEAARCPGYDATVLPVANQALALVGSAPLARLPDLFSGIDKALVTLPELSHYGQGYGADVHWAGPAYVGDVGQAPTWPAGPGPRVFAYLDPVHAAFDATMAALRDSGVAALVHAKGLSPQAAQRLGGPRLHFEASPLKVDEAVAGADLVVSHASLGVATAAALGGKPQLVLPSHAEQSMVARRLVEAGVARQVPLGQKDTPVRPLLDALLNEPRHAEAARALATRHAGATPRRTGETLANLIEATLPR